jgi:tRNA dimethylallyltransferase
MNAPLVVIVGPTASGKSDLAMQVARQHNGELICADSRTVYVGADIGTAKPSAKDRAEIPHYLLDVVRPDQQFTAADFKQRAERLIEQITKRGKLPIIVGGTGLYVDSLLFDYQFGALPDEKRREELSALSVEELQKICSDNDIEIPINDKNKRHLIRAIELGGLPHIKRNLRANTVVVGITTEKEILRQRIEQRANAMLNEGIVQEVRRLSERFGWDAPAMTGNIYRIFRPVIEGNESQDDAIAKFIQSDVSLAKRQLTWLKRNPFIIWGQPEQLKSAIDVFLKSPLSS